MPPTTNHRASETTAPDPSSAALDALPFLQAVQRTCTCAICLGILKEPVLLPCTHVFCSSCIRTALETNRPQCPLCNAPVRSMRQLTPLPQLAMITSIAVEMFHQYSAASPSRSPSLAQRPAPSRLSPPSTSTVSRPSPPPHTLDETQLVDSAGPGSWWQHRKRRRPDEGVDGTPTPVRGPGARTDTVELLERVRAAVREPTPELPGRLHPAGRTGSAAAAPTDALPHVCQFWQPARCPRPPTDPPLGPHVVQLVPPLEEVEFERCPSAGAGPAASACGPSPGSQPQWDGACVLCGLNLYHRDDVRTYLHRLLSRSDAACCDAAELQQLTVSCLGKLLGPLWGLRLERGTGGDAAMETVTVPAHQNCLAWAGWLHFGFFTSDTASVEATLAKLREMLASRGCWVPGPLVATPSGDAPPALARLQQLWEWVWQRVDNRPGEEEEEEEGCYLCGSGEGPAQTAAGLRPCAAALQPARSCTRRCHYPCALLAGSRACVVYGLEEAEQWWQGQGQGTADPTEVWCGACRQRK